MNKIILIGFLILLLAGCSGIDKFSFGKELCEKEGMEVCRQTYMCTECCIKDGHIVKESYYLRASVGDYENYQLIKGECS